MNNESRFWIAFAANAKVWAEVMRSGRVQEAFDSIDALLQSHGIQHCFDITPTDDDCLLTFSPEGDADAGADIDRFVATAPRCANWRILTRRQKKDVGDVAAIVQELYFVDPRSAQFRFSHRGGAPHIEMYMPADTDLRPAEAQGLINTFLWHALGEGFVMERNIHGSVQLTDAPPDGALSASELVTRAGQL